MLHAPWIGKKLINRYRIFGLLLALLLACSALLYMGGTAHAATNSAVTFANNNWNCATAACTTRVSAGQAQNGYECAEFVARALSTLGIIYGPNGDLGTHSAQSAYGNDKLGSKTWDLLWVGYAPPYDGLKQYLLDNGLATNIGTNISKASPGDVVIYPGDDGKGHTAILVKINGANSLVDQHNVAAKGINYKEYASIDILHIV